MGTVFEAIDDKLRAWIEERELFFVATAPNSGEGLLNCSPKGLDTFRFLGPKRVAYLDLTGSGIETIAHLKENERIVIMFCAFKGAPRILRIHGRGTVHEPGSDDFDELVRKFPEIPGTRSVIEVNATRIADSCGYGVPEMQLVRQRDTLIKYTTQKGPEKMADYRRQKNRLSLDGLPGLDLEPAEQNDG